MEHTHNIIEFIFPPHAVCWNQRSDIIATHAVGDALTAIAYYLIPITLIYVTRKYHFDPRLKFILGVYGTFIFLCGTTHIFDVVMIWHITETILIVDGWLRVLTGAVSAFSLVVTIWAAVNFLKFTDAFFGTVVEMKKDRDAVNRVRDETWKRFEEQINQAARLVNHNGKA